MDWVLPGSPAHGILQAITLERVAKAFSGAFPAQGLDLALLRHRWACYPLSLRESPLCPTQIASSLFLRVPTRLFLATGTASRSITLLPVASCPFIPVKCGNFIEPTWSLLTPLCYHRHISICLYAVSPTTQVLNNCFM